MKTLVIYSSKTGFTEKYAKWIAEETECELIALKDAKKKEETFYKAYDAIVYGGWTMASKIVDLDWFLTKAEQNKDKKIAVFGVGATPSGDKSIDKMLAEALNEEQKSFVKMFYCPGGLNYEKMKFPSKFILKGMSSSLMKKKDPTDEEKAMGELLSKSFDNSDKKYALEIVDYLKK